MGDFNNFEPNYEAYGVNENDDLAYEQAQWAQMTAEDLAQAEAAYNNYYNQIEGEQERLRTNRYRNQTRRALMNARDNLPENVARRITGMLNVPWSRPVNIHPALQHGFSNTLFKNNNNNNYAPPPLVNIGLHANPYGNMPDLEPLPIQNNVNGLNGGSRLRKRRATRRRKTKRSHRNRRSRRN